MRRLRIRGCPRIWLYVQMKISSLARSAALRHHQERKDGYQEEAKGTTY